MALGREIGALSDCCTGCGWSDDTSSNCDFIGTLIQTGAAAGAQVGVYASSYMWSSIAGSDCTVGADNGCPLWYAHYDVSEDGSSCLLVTRVAHPCLAQGNPSFDDFESFGGWSSPFGKWIWL